MLLPIHILIVEDDPTDAELLVLALRRAGFEPEWRRVDTELDYLSSLHAGLDLVLSDFMMPQFSGLRALELLKQRRLDVPFIIVSGAIGEETAVVAMQEGAADYLLKDRLSRLGAAVERALGETRLRRERVAAEAAKAATATQLMLLETCVARLNDIVLITEAEPQDEPGPRILFVNDGFVRRTGYSREEALGRSPRFLQGPKTSRAELDRIRAAMRRWQPVRSELINYTKAGEAFWIELDMVPVADAKGWFTHWVAIERDITERKHADEVLRASEERLRMVTDNAQVGLVLVNADRRYTFANATFFEMLGLPPADIVGLHVGDVKAPLFAGRASTHLDLAFAGERVAYELHSPAPGEDRYFAIRYEPTNVGGSVALVVKVIVDITARKRAEEARSASEARYRTLFEYAPCGILIADSGSIYVDANASLCRMLGYSREELIGLHVSDIVAAGERLSFESALRAIKSMVFYRREWQFQRKDGSVFEAEVIATAMPDGNLLGMIRDVTARKRAQVALQESAAQLRALALRLENIREQERTAIAREIHDVLAQELTQLKIDLVWLAKHAPHPADESMREKIAVRAGDALTQTDTAISTVQRIATELRPVILDSLGLSAAVEWQTEDFARRSGLGCRVKTSGDESTLTRDRATALFRILQESLTNVARHAHAANIEVELTETSDAVLLIVQDDGVGITREQMDDPLSIGLLGMRERVLAFGGSLEFSSSPDTGTAVIVRLPIETPPPLATSP